MKMNSVGRLPLYILSTEANRSGNRKMFFRFSLCLRARPMKHAENTYRMAPIRF